MGKYDRIFQSDAVFEEFLSPEEAVAAILLKGVAYANAIVTAAADSSLENLEIEWFADILSGFEVFEEHANDELLEILDRLITLANISQGNAKSEGLGALFNSANDSLADELVLDGFAAGVSVLVDEDKLIIPKPKTPLLKQLQEALEIEDTEAEEVIDSVLNAFAESEDENENIDIYESPLGNFRLPIPVTPEQGGKIQSQEGTVGFSDDLGTLLRIDYYPIPDNQIEEMRSLGQQQYFQSILLNKYIPQVIVSNLPEANVVYTDNCVDVIEGAFFALANMPDGASISRQEENGHSQRLDAYRGLIIFSYCNFLYIISSQRCFFDGETHNSIEEEAELIKAEILEFIDSIEFK
ncbi:hypothetical protein [Brunnivagina elsteri]|uniref:Uncharacterized protein n=1 Tax=Brunnivagina elsteri CCALA 953 TaxID=987040 RepID=A0A2A2TEG7_9CYAN|nr:hypothetical protein [Calothrix elsteri]PAX52150.1 hypothetical protein CK510_20890 [Calothrix elsteri CCALA 953]